MVHYTKAEMKLLRDFSVSDEEVANRLNRSKQAVYCKRWTMKKKGLRGRKPKAMLQNIVSEGIIREVVEQTTNTAVERVVLGNVTIDLVSKTLTIKF